LKLAPEAQKSGPREDVI